MPGLSCRAQRGARRNTHKQTQTPHTFQPPTRPFLCYGLQILLTFSPTTNQQLWLPAARPPPPPPPRAVPSRNISTSRPTLACMPKPISLCSRTRGSSRSSTRSGDASTLSTWQQSAVISPHLRAGLTQPSWSARGRSTHSETSPKSWIRKLTSPFPSSNCRIYCTRNWPPLATLVARRGGHGRNSKTKT